MARLIDADALIERLKAIRDLYGTKNERERAARGGVVACICAVHDAPTVNAEPVRNGRWIDWSMWGESKYQCTECNAEMKYKTNFCPRCGAKMESEVQDDDER